MPTTILQSLKRLLIFQALIALIGGGVIAHFLGSQLGASYVVGAVLMTANLAFLAWSSWRLFSKKSIAWTVMIIVIKYAVLLGSIVILARASWFDSLFAGLGIASFVIAALFTAISQKKENIEIGSSSL